MRYCWTVLLLAVWVAHVATAQEAPPAEAAPAPAPAPAPPPAPEPPDKPKQVVVSAKIIEFQATKGVETGLSAYFARRNKLDFWGVIHTPNAGIMTADVTFPSSTSGGITVFLDRLRMTEGDVEMVLQALVDENRASILSQPKVMVVRGGGLKTKIQTTQKVPYENTVVVGATTVQTTDFRDTGVMLEVEAPEIYDVDGDWTTTDDTIIQLAISAEVSEEGQRITIALGDQVATGGGVSVNTNAIRVPEFVKRSVNTHLFVRNGQVLVLGGLYRNSKSRSLASPPFFSQAEDMAVGFAERFIPGDYLASPISATLGNRRVSDERRELVFLIKAEVWRPAYTVADEYGFTVSEPEAATPKQTPSDLIRGVIEGVTDIPQDIRDRTAPSDGGIADELGGGR